MNAIETIKIFKAKSVFKICKIPVHMFLAAFLEVVFGSMLVTSLP